MEKNNTNQENIVYDTIKSVTSYLSAAFMYATSTLLHIKYCIQVHRFSYKVVLCCCRCSCNTLTMQKLIWATGCITYQTFNRNHYTAHNYKLWSFKILFWKIFQIEGRTWLSLRNDFYEKYAFEWWYSAANDPCAQKCVFFYFNLA